MVWLTDLAPALIHWTGGWLAVSWGMWVPILQDVTWVHSHGDCVHLAPCAVREGKPHRVRVFSSLHLPDACG